MRRLMAVAALAVVLAGCGASTEDNERVMTEVAKRACRTAVENEGWTGDFVYRVKPKGDDWAILVTVNSGAGLRTWVCTAVRDGETVNATVEVL